MTHTQPFGFTDFSDAFATTLSAMGRSPAPPATYQESVNTPTAIPDDDRVRHLAHIDPAGTRSHLRSVRPVRVHRCSSPVGGD